MAAAEPGTILVRGAAILTMDDTLGDLSSGDILIVDGVIERVAAKVDAPPSATILDATGMLALPGFVETHWHLWNTILRGVVGDGGAGYMAQKARLGPLYRPEDTYAAVRLALAEAITGGVTTVHDWSHNVLRPEDADADLRAVHDSGIRARYSYGAPSTAQGLTLAEMADVMAGVFPVDRPMDMADVERIRRVATEAGASPRVTVGVTLRGPARSTPSVYREEWSAARVAGLPIAMHCAGTLREVRIIRQAEILAAEGLLGPDVLLAHGNHLTPAELEAVAATGTGLTISPLGELRGGAPIVAIDAVHRAGIVIGLSFDTTSSTSADMFALMRITLDVENARLGDPAGLTPARVVAMATIDGARLLGLDGVTGSLTPGKRADIQLVRTTDPNLAPLGDPYAAIVHGGQPSNVDTVLIDGVVRKRAGELVGVDIDAVVGDAAAALARLRARATAKVAAPPPGITGA